MKFVFLVSILTGLALPFARGQDVERERAVQTDPNAPIPAKAIDVFRGRLITHIHDLSALLQATQATYEREYILWFVRTDSDILNELSMLEDEVYAWSLLNAAAQTNVERFFDRSRGTIQDDLETALPLAAKVAAAPHSSSRFISETTQNKADLRAIRDWVTVFRFRRSDERLSGQR